MAKLIAIIVLLLLIDQCTRHARRNASDESQGNPAVSIHINHSKPASTHLNDELTP